VTDISVVAHMFRDYNLAVL